MKQIHVVLRRINPALKIDLAQVGYLEDNQFVSLPISSLKDTFLPALLKEDSISDSCYVFHSDVSTFVSNLSSLPGFAVEFFDNTLVLMFDLDINPHEITSEEKG